MKTNRNFIKNDFMLYEQINVCTQKTFHKFVAKNVITIKALKSLGNYF